MAVNYAESGEAAAETLELMRAAGGQGGVFRADVASWEAVSAMFDAVEAERGPVDLLVTNAGAASFQDDANMPLELWRRILSVNLDGAFHCVWRAKEAMRARKDGRIVCISSVNGIAPSRIRRDRLIAYGTSKSAVIGFTRNCAAALGPEIRVNCVAPGLIDTDMTKDMSGRNARPHRRRDAGRADGNAGGCRRTDLLSAERRRQLRHRPDLRDLRRAGDAAVTRIGVPSTPEATAPSCLPVWRGGGRRPGRSGRRCRS